MIRIGMFVTAKFYGGIPRSIPLFPQQRFFICTTANGSTCRSGNGHFRRAPVVQDGTMFPNKQQEIVFGIKPGDQVVSNALDLQNTVEQ